MPYCLTGQRCLARVALVYNEGDERMNITASLRVKLLIAFCSVSFITLASISGYDLYRMNKEVDQNISVLRQNLMDQFDRGLKL